MYVLVEITALLMAFLLLTMVCMMCSSCARLGNIQGGVTCGVSTVRIISVVCGTTIEK